VVVDGLLVVVGFGGLVVGCGSTGISVAGGSVGCGSTGASVAGGSVGAMVGASVGA